MSSAVKSKAVTMAQRSAEAVQRASEILGVDDTKRLGAALTIAVAERLHDDHVLLECIRSIYEDLAPKRVSNSKGQKKRTAPEPEAELIPVKSMEGQPYDPSAPIDPYFLLELYGPGQLNLALSRYTAPRLREGVKAVQARHPGTKPGGTGKQALIDYITAILLPLQM